MDLNEKKELAKTELKKAFQLSTEGVDVKMFSKYIDKVWHEMADNPEEYERFCLESCGQIITHSQQSGEGVVDFVQIYEERFGKMPDVWFMDEEANLNIENFVNHLEGRQTISGWDCTPTHNG